MKNESKITVIHQPHFLPWLGYFNKLSNCNQFIMQDNVQFRKRYFQNRTLIQNSQKRPIWFTIPVNAERNTLIRDVIISDKKWNKRLVKTLIHSYKKEKFYSENFEFVSNLILNCKYEKLVDVNYFLLKETLNYLSINVEFDFSHKFRKQSTPTEDLVQICLYTETNIYLFGEGGGKNYHGTSMFHKNKIKTTQQKFKENFNRINKNIFPENDKMSILHYLFVIGREETEKIIKNTWIIKERIK